MSTELRILFVIPGVGKGSSMVFARRQAEALARRGVPVEIFYLRSRTSPAVLWREAVRFRRMCAGFRPDVIHAQFGTVTALFTVLLSGSTPVVITFRGSDLNPVPSAAGPRAALARLFSQLAALRASRIVCVSRQLRERLWWRHDRATVLPSGVDTTQFQPMPRERARAALGWMHRDPVVVFNAGHDPRNKRLDLARAAFAVVQRRRPEVRLEVLAGNVPPERIPLVLNAADCLLVTSDAEGSPTVVQEAIATNLPVVSVAVGDVAERLAGISQTRIVERTPEALAEAVLKILACALRSDGRSRAREVSASHIAEELYQNYCDLAAPARGTVSWNTTLSSPQ